MLPVASRPTTLALIFTAAIGCGRTPLSLGGGGDDSKPATPKNNSCDTLVHRGQSAPVRSVAADIGSESLHTMTVLPVGGSSSGLNLFALAPTEAEPWARHLRGSQLTISDDEGGTWGQELTLHAMPMDIIHSYAVARKSDGAMMALYGGTMWLAYDLPADLTELGPSAYANNGAARYLSYAEDRVLIGTGDEEQNFRVFRRSETDWAFEPATVGICGDDQQSAAVVAPEGWLVAVSQNEQPSGCPTPPGDRLIVQHVSNLGLPNEIYTEEQSHVIVGVDAIELNGSAWVFTSSELDSVVMTARELSFEGELLREPFVLVENASRFFAVEPFRGGFAVAWLGEETVELRTYDADGVELQRTTQPLPLEGAYRVDEAPSLASLRGDQTLLLGYALGQAQATPEMSAWLSRWDCQ